MFSCIKWPEALEEGQNARPVHTCTWTGDTSGETTDSSERQKASYFTTLVFMKPVSL